MIDIVRGVSIHSTSEGLQYYAHYDIAGTVKVDEEDYNNAVDQLNKWRQKVKKTIENVF
jgi:hypothetical protein